MARLQNTFTSLSTLFQSLVLALVQTVYVKCKVLAKLHGQTARCSLTSSSPPDIPPPSPHTPLLALLSLSPTHLACRTLHLIHKFAQKDFGSWHKMCSLTLNLREAWTIKKKLRLYVQSFIFNSSFSVTLCLGSYK